MRLKLQNVLWVLRACLGLCYLLLVSFEGISQAQSTVKVHGTVLTETGEALEGVTIVAKNNANKKLPPKMTVSAASGSFEFEQLNMGDHYDFEFSFVGFETASKKLLVTQQSSSSSIAIQLKQKGNDQLNEVVVTALGIKREKMSLGYASQTITDQQMTDARSNNWISALSGKVAGLNLISPGSGPVNSTRIQLRGDRSLSADGNDALVVIDGVPVSNTSTSSGVDNGYQAGSGADVPIDFGNGISDINPDDIESVTVLKGAGATALYGSRAANGALLITTKAGSRKTKGIGITINSNSSVNDVLKWPDYQHEYGQGVGKTFTPAADLYYSYGNSADGAGNSGTSSAFGPKFLGQQFFQYDPAKEGQSAERLPWVAHPDNVKGFWRTGYTLANSVSMDGANDKGSGRLSVTHTKNEWIMPNTGFERLNVAANANYAISEKLKINTRINYTNKKSDNLPATGYNNQSVAYFMIFQNPNVDLGWYAPIWKKGKEQVDQIHPFSSFIDNPYLIAYEMTNALTSNNIVGNASINYKFNQNLDLLVRSGISITAEERKQRRPFSTANFGKGYYKEQTINNYEINTDALLSYHKDLGSRVKLNVAAGGNLMRARYTATNAYVDGLVTPGIYKLSNGLYNVIYRGDHRNKNINSIYGFTNLAFDEKIFLDLTARNDWSSTLPSANNSYFYPSASASFILSKLLNLPKEVSYAKARLSVALAGSDADPYLTSKYYINNEFPSSATVNNTLYNANFKPQLSTSYEGGLEFQLFGNRVGVDASYYYTSTRNQILEVALEQSTGYSKALVNSGEVRNQGIELMLTGKPINGKNLKWNTSITWARNYNKVVSLTDGMTDQQLIGTGGNASIVAKVGGSTGDIYGFGFVRSPDGQIVFDKSGLTSRPAEIQFIGNAYADWKGGVFNEFQYKNYRFSFLVDGQYGGKIYSQSHHKMSEQGKLKNTIKGRDEGFIIGEGVVLNADGKTYSPNTTKATVGDYYADFYRRANVEANTFNASYLKLREVRLEYNLPTNWLSNTFIYQASVALYGRDLAMLTSFPLFDPETAALNGTSILPGIEMGQLPTPRTFGINVTLKF